MSDTNDRNLGRVRVALALAKADERIAATVPDPYLPACSSTVCYATCQFSVVLVFLDRCSGAPTRDGPVPPGQRDLLKVATSVLAVQRHELHALSVAELNDLVARRLEAALRKWTPVKFGEADNEWVGRDAAESLEIR